VYGANVSFLQGPELEEGVKKKKKKSMMAGIDQFMT
jgi:hypothetical protein